MLKKRIIISLTFQDGVLFRTKKFIPDYRYTKILLIYGMLMRLYL